MIHPNDTSKPTTTLADGQHTPWRVFTDGGAVHVDWDNEAPLTPHGQLPFFAEYLHVSERFSQWAGDCPLSYTSNNAPEPEDVLGTLMLSVLCGHTRYSHIDSIRGDGVSPEVLGINKLVSSDSARRAFAKVEAEAAETWQLKHLRQTYEALLCNPYILDVDVSVVPLYGHQEGAEKGYNPSKPGRPSHAYHIYFIGNLRIVLDVEVKPGNQTAGCYSRPGIFRLLDVLPERLWPSFLRGDVGYGNNPMMQACEERGLSYLFKLPQNSTVKTLIKRVAADPAGWTEAGNGWQGRESTFKMDAWSEKRRVILLRRVHTDNKRQSGAKSPALTDKKQGEFTFVEAIEQGAHRYEYAVLVTDLEQPILTIAQLYRDRADCENVIDELKNQWGCSGFTTQDLARTQIMARLVCQVYNWWNVYCRLAIPEKHAEALTSRPFLWETIGRLVRSAGQRLIRLSSVDARAEQAKQLMGEISAFLQSLRSTAPQLSAETRWSRILSHAFRAFLGHKQLLAQSAGAQGLLGI